MGKWVAAEVLDLALGAIAQSTRMVALAAAPAGYGDALSGRLAEAAMSPDDFVIGAGAGSGRKVDIAAKGGLAVTAAGTASHVALLDTAAAKLLYVTTCPPQALVAGAEVRFDGWSVEIAAPL